MVRQGSSRDTLRSRARRMSPSVSRPQTRRSPAHTTRAPVPAASSRAMASLIEAVEAMMTASIPSDGIKRGLRHGVPVLPRGAPRGGIDERHGGDADGVVGGDADGADGAQ